MVQAPVNIVVGIIHDNMVHAYHICVLEMRVLLDLIVSNLSFQVQVLDLYKSIKL